MKTLLSIFFFIILVFFFKNSIAQDFYQNKKYGYLLSEQKEKLSQADEKKKSFYSLGSLILLLVLFVALSMLSGNFLQGLRCDLTENKLFTLSGGTTKILEELQEPVTLYFYFSQDASSDIPQVRSYAKRVDELLEEFVNHSNGKLSLQRIDPAPFSEEEDQAAADNTPADSADEPDAATAETVDETSPDAASGEAGEDE